MRTKTLLCLAALTAAGVTASMAQSSNVYSLNVVGYINVAITNGAFSYINNPLDNTAGNDLNHIMPGAPDNTSVFRWNVGIQDFDIYTNAIPTYSAGGSTWIPNVVIAPGEGIFVAGGNASGYYTNTFVGDVKQTTTTFSLAGGGNFNSLGSPVPLSGSLTNILAQYVADDNDSVFIWNEPGQDLDAALGGPIYSWSAGSSPPQWIPDANIKLGQGFFLVPANPGTKSWVRNYTVPQTP